jgi:hypothetical protein
VVSVGAFLDQHHNQPVFLDPASIQLGRHSSECGFFSESAHSEFDLLSLLVRRIAVLFALPNLSVFTKRLVNLSIRRSRYPPDELRTKGSRQLAAIRIYLAARAGGDFRTNLEDLGIADAMRRLRQSEEAIPNQQSHEMVTMAAPLTQILQWAVAGRIVQLIYFEYLRLVPGGGGEPPRPCDRRILRAIFPQKQAIA